MSTDTRLLALLLNNRRVRNRIALNNQNAESATNAEQDAPTPSLSSSVTTTSSSHIKQEVNATTTNTTPSASTGVSAQRYDLNQISREHLQCPVCLDSIRAKPIYQCPNGHTICSACLPKLTACPLCREILSIGNGNGKIRNISLETLMDHAQVTCPHRNKGCLQMVKGSSLKQHVAECAFGRFILCPGLGFATCTEPLYIENWAKHVCQMHKLVVHPGRHSTVIITYSDILSAKTVKEGSILAWEPLVLTPFPEAGPFLIVCEQDTQKNGTVSFSCIYAPPKPIASDEDDGVDEDVTSYFVEFSVGESHPVSGDAWLPDRVKSRRMSVLYSEFEKGKGQFKIPLSQYCLPETATTHHHNSTPDLSAFGAAALPLQNNLSVLNADSGNGSEEPTRQRAPQVKKDLKIRVRIAKSLKDLALPSCPSETCSVTITKYTAAKTTPTYRAVKCTHCKKGPLRGIRYKCTECPKFDLCSACMTENKVHTHHHFAFIRDSKQSTRMKSNFKRIYRKGPEEADNSAEQDENRAPPPKRVRKTPPTAARNNVAVAANTSNVSNSSYVTATNTSSTEDPDEASSLLHLAPPS